MEELRENELKAQLRHDYLCLQLQERLDHALAPFKVLAEEAAATLDPDNWHDCEEGQLRKGQSKPSSSDWHPRQSNATTEDDEMTEVGNTPSKANLAQSRASATGRRVLPSVSRYLESYRTRQLINSLSDIPSITTDWKLFCKYSAMYVVSWSYFEYVIGLIIFVNAGVVGLSITADLEGNDMTPYTILENIFMAIYIVEVCLRFIAYGVQKNLKDPWVVFDIVLICLGGITVWVLEPVVAAQPEDADSTINSILTPLLIFRIFRLLRLLRALRLVNIFRTLWRLVQGLLHSLGTMCWTFVLVGITLYVFACCAVELITKDEFLRRDPRIEEVASRYFRSIPVTMMSLLQFVTADSIHEIYWDLVMKQPLFIIGVIAIILVVAVALMNLVTAVIVEKAIDNAAMDKEMMSHYNRKRCQDLIPQLRTAFRQIDENGDGSLTLAEIVGNLEALPKEVQDVMAGDAAAEVFEMLDIDGSGLIGEAEIVEGMLQLMLSDVPFETTRMMHTLRVIRFEIAEMRDELKATKRAVDPSLSKRLPNYMLGTVSMGLARISGLREDAQRSSI